MLMAVAAQTTTSSTIPEIVGEPLPEWVVVVSGLAVLIFVLVAGWLARRRIRRREA